MTTRTVLILDDDTATGDLDRQLDQFGYAVRRVATPEAMTSANGDAAAVLVRIAGTGPAATAAIAAMAAPDAPGPQVPPLIVLCDDFDLAPRLAAVRAGAAAYLGRDADALALVDTLERLCGSAEEEPFRVMVVDDDPRISRYYRAVLETAGIEALTVTEPMQALRALSEFRPELVLMDLYMPDCAGRELAAAIRQEPAFDSIPIVFLSAEDDPVKQLAVMTIGGDDFLTKPIQPDHLISAIQTRARRFRALRSTMQRDSLTGLLNHTATKEQLGIELSRARRSHGPLSFALIDLDHFKAVNDTYGHPAGDRVIKTLASLLKRRLRLTDSVGRYGGEEFAVVLVGTDGANALSVMDGVREAFADIRQQHESGSFAVSFSCGLATFPAQDSATAITDAADKALYRAKKDGRNRIVLAG
ncbi:MAG: diguanylate cyclase [Alphaproteobacteria bacterium]